MNPGTRYWSTSGGEMSSSTAETAKPSHSQRIMEELPGALPTTLFLETLMNRGRSGQRRSSSSLLRVYGFFIPSTGHIGQPAKLVLSFSLDDLEVPTLNTLGDWSPPSAADRDAINRADGCYFRGRSGEEYFVGNVEHLA